MAGLQSVVPYIPVIQQGVGIVTGALSGEASYRDQEKSQRQALQNLQAQQNENMQQMQENARLQQQQIGLSAQQADEERRAALKRAVARQRAQFGSSGIGNASSGSAEAVLLGLFDESEDERARREQMDNLRLTAINQDLDQQNRLNVLQRTQLQQRAKLNGLSSQIDRYGNLVNSGLNALQYASEVSDLF